MIRMFIHAFVAAAVLAIPAAVRAQERPARPEAMREEAARLEEKARQLKQEGRGEDAEKLMREVRELRERVEAVRRERGDRPPAGPRHPDADRRELKERLQIARAELKELKVAGREPEARELGQKVARMEQRLEAMNRPGPGRGPGPGERREGGPRPPGDGERVEHIRIAVEHLHAAGLHEAAERVALLAEGDRPGPGAGRRPEGGPPGGADRLAAQVEELRNVVREMNARLERLEHGGR